MSEFLSSDGFLSRAHCGSGWVPTLIVAYQIANLVAALAYLLIPASLLWLWCRRRASLPYPSILLGFAAFIVLCSTTHLCEVVVFYWPAYRLFAVITGITAIVSIYVAICLPAVVRYVRIIATPEAYAAMVARAAAAERAYQLSTAAAQTAADGVRDGADDLSIHLAELELVGTAAKRADFEAKTQHIRAILKRIRVAGDSGVLTRGPAVGLRPDLPPTSPPSPDSILN